MFADILFLRSPVILLAHYRGKFGNRPKFRPPIFDWENRGSDFGTFRPSVVVPESKNTPPPSTPQWYDTWAKMNRILGGPPLGSLGSNWCSFGLGVHEYTLQLFGLNLKMIAPKFLFQLWLFHFSTFEVTPNFYFFEAPLQNTHLKIT